MQLTIEHEPDGHGMATPDEHGELVEVAPSSSEFTRALVDSVQELREAVLQVLSGALPYLPRVQVHEGKNAVLITTHLADIDEESVHVVFDGPLLRISGVRTSRREILRRKYRRVEKIHRTFDRAIPIYWSVDRQKAVATLRKNVLRISMPKTAASRASMTPVRVVIEGTSGLS
jgi:HSP20 family molecular chaperone IbpA